MTRPRSWQDDIDQHMDIQRRLQRLELGAIERVSDLPTQPYDGMTATLYDDPEVPLDWSFRYHEGFGWPWVFQGGPDLWDSNLVSETRGPWGAANQFVLFNNNVSVPIKYRGVYDVYVHVYWELNNTSNGYLRIRPFYNGLVDDLAVVDQQMYTGNQWDQKIWVQRQRVVVPSHGGNIILAAAVNNTTSQVTFFSKSIYVTPVRVATT